MIRHPKCLITGCELYDHTQDRWVHGDLHRIGSSYVFNAVLYDGEAHWMYDTPLPKWAKALHIDNGAPYFERRGIIVVGILDAELNEHAKKYLHLETPVTR